MSFATTPLWVDGGVFAVAAALVWIAGTRLTGHVDAVTRHTRLGQALAGMLILGIVTSLPEMAVAVTATIRGHESLAVNNVLGGVAMQIVVLAVVDALFGRRALTSVVVDPAVLLQGVFGILLLALVAAATVVGDRAVLGIGLWAWAIAAAYVGVVWILARAQGDAGWVARGRDGERREPAPGGARRDRAADGERRDPEPPDANADGASGSGGAPIRRALRGIAATAAVVVVAGALLSWTGEAIATKTGLGTSFVGAVLVAASTSLPEVSTVLAAVKLGRYALATSDIFGTNLADVSLVWLIDAVSPRGPVLASVGDFACVAALLGIVVTALFTAGLVERRDVTVLRMGVDSFAVLAAYATGLVLLYQLR